MSYPFAPVESNVIHFGVGSMESLGFSPIKLGGSDYNTSRAWPSANLALFVPLQLRFSILVAKLWVMNGATASGNVDLGIYKEDGTRIVSSGSTAQAGTNGIQELDITDTRLIGPARYYIAICADNTTQTMFSAAYGAGLHQSCGIVQQATAFPLATNASPATFAACTTNFIPNFGLSTRTLVA